MGPRNVAFVLVALLCLPAVFAREQETLDPRSTTIDLTNSSVGKYVTIGDSFSFKLDEEWKTLNITDLDLRNISVRAGPPDTDVNLSNGTIASFALGASQPRVSVVLNRTLGDIAQITIMLYDASYVAPKDKVWPNATVANASSETVNTTTAQSANVSPQSTPPSTVSQPTPATATSTTASNETATAPTPAPPTQTPSATNVTSTLPPEEKATANVGAPSLNTSSNASQVNTTEPASASQATEPDLTTGILVGLAAVIATLLVLFVLGKALKAD
ncbi:hypothetical protein HY642_04505 [Candidatus Woesearchaeota archaeon]|nr:hypothetical protein [Candidatus Woesearchaeota archaeon]